ncbi:MAG: hypothetical protein OXC81_05985 [Betaproteobacteria bacterium]|nr:hypothetical protein [Betaproteobacteria bacterium]
MNGFGQSIVKLAGLLLLLALIVLDHASRPGLDHDALEQRRASGVFQCAPCGQACEAPAAADVDQPI